ncbi:MAG TPA: hypothetical protein VM013_05380 [Dehalococcoidia bacterium]|nr:hypothetical protein [Dehalococcoidia bacterium]
MMGLRQRWRGMMRRRLMALRGRIDRRIERLDEKRQRLATKVTKRGAKPAVEEPVPVTGPAAAVGEAKRPSRRRPSRRRPTPPA